MKIYERLSDELANAIASGRLKGGTALPTVRNFARQRQIGLSTAARVYAELQRQGLVTGEVGRGTFVRDRPIDPGPLAAAARYASTVRLAESIDASTLRLALRAVSGLPDLERLNAQYSPLGNSAVRRALAVHLSYLRRNISPAQIAVVSSGLAATRLAALVTLERGQRVATDSITYPGWRLVAGQLGLELDPITFDHDGPTPNSLERLLRKKRIAALHCMPTAHHPLGWMMPLSRRSEIAALAQAYDIAIFEDVTYNHLATDAPPALAELAPERTWQIGSMSGVLGDGLRLGYVVTPKLQEAKLEKAAFSWGLTAPPLIVELARHWLDDGTIESLQKAQRTHARMLWQTISSSELASRSLSSCGWCFWLPVQNGHRCEEMVSELRHQGIGAVGSEPFAVTSSKPNALLIRLRTIAPAKLGGMVGTILETCT